MLIFNRVQFFEFQFLLKPDKFSFQSRESRLTLSFTERGKSAVSMHLREAEPNQLRAFIDVLNNVKAYNASFKGGKMGKLKVICI